MDYKKKYEELLARLQEAKENAYKTDERYCCVIDSIVPELKESEDEKARRVLREIVLQWKNGHQAWCSDDKEIDAILAWLKNQGEKGTNGNEREIPNSEQKPADKVEPKFHVGDMVKRKDNPHLTYILKRLTDDGDYEFRAIGKDGHEGCTCFATVKYQDEWELIEQNPAWSEEDKAVLDALIRRLEGEDVHVSPHLAAECLKSLKDRVGCETNCTTTWKPSDEHYELEEFAKIVRCNLTGVSKAVQKLFEAKYLQLTGNKMYGGFIYEYKQN